MQRGWHNKKLFPLQKRHLRGNLLESFKILKEFTNVDEYILFSIGDLLRTRSNKVKNRSRQIQLDFIKLFLTNDVVRELNSLPQ